MSDWRFVGVSAAKDLRKLWRDPLGLLLSVTLPIIICILLTLIFGRGGATPRGTVLIVDHDDTTLSSLMRGAFGQGPLAKMINVELVEAADGRARIGRGDASALVEIPQGFQRAVLRDDPIELKLVTNPAQTILPGIVKESLLILSEGAFYAQSLFGDQIRQYVDRPPTELEIAQMSVMGKRLGDKLEKFLDPPVIALETTKAEKQSTPLGALFFPGMLFFGVILVGQTLSADIWKEKAAGTLRRTLMTSSRPWAFLGGRMAAVAVVMFAVAILAMVFARVLLQLDVAYPLLALAWVVLAGVVFNAWFVLINLLATGERGANVLTSIVVFFLAIVGGGMFPLDVMPEWLARFGRWLPNGWASTEFSKLIQGKLDWPHFRAAAAMMLALGTAAFGMVVLRLRRFVLR